MNNIFEKFNPFTSREEDPPMIERDFNGNPFPNNKNHMTLVESPFNNDSATVVNRGAKQDCEMIEYHLNVLMQEHLAKFLDDNSEDIIDYLISKRENARQQRLKDLGYKEPTEEYLANIRSGRSLI